jgi:FMN phosphatase YigB (HAD superfamily)
MYVGDHHEIDIVGAKGANIMAVLIGEKPNPNTASAPDHVVANLREVYEIAIRLD